MLNIDILFLSSLEKSLFCFPNKPKKSKIKIVTTKLFFFFPLSFASAPPVYATVYNFDQALSDVNTSLLTQGFISEPLTLSSTDPKDLVKTVNCLFAILQQRQKDIGDREEAADRARRIQCDKDNLSQNLVWFFNSSLISLFILNPFLVVPRFFF